MHYLTARLQKRYPGLRQAGAILLWFALFSFQGLGATTIRTMSAGSVASRFELTVGRFPIDLSNAKKMAFADESSCQEMEFSFTSPRATTVIPHGEAWAAMAGGNPEGFASSGLKIDIGQPRPLRSPRKLDIHVATQKQSEHASAYRISIFTGATPSRDFLNISKSMCRGDDSSFRLTCNSRARALASAVTLSFAEIRSSENLSLTAPILIEPYVAMATANAPTNKMILNESYQNVAASNETSNISTLTVLGFISLAVAFFLPIMASFKKALESWRKWRH